MTVKEAITKLQKQNSSDKLKIIQEEELECMPEWWDEEKREPSGEATEIFSEDLHSHQVYLLTISEG